MKRIDLLVNDSLYNEYMQRNALEEKELGLCLHGIKPHFEIAHLTLKLMLENNEVDLFMEENGLGSHTAAAEVIYAAGLLHDIGRWKEYRDWEEHTPYSAKLARAILPRALFTSDEIEIICCAINEHRSISQDISFLGERLYRAKNLSHV